MAESSGSERGLLPPPSSERTPVDPPHTDDLELELRLIPGVNFIDFADSDAGVVVEVGTDGSVDDAVVAAAVTRLSRAYLPTAAEVQVRVLGQLSDLDATSNLGGPTLRVRLLTTINHGEEGPLEVHLSHGGHRVVARADPQDLPQVGQSVIEALRQLGFPLPFDVESAHALSADLGSGVLVVMIDRVTGQHRRGIAEGRSGGEATARAVLNGLNRHLQRVNGAPGPS